MESLSISKIKEDLEKFALEFVGDEKQFIDYSSGKIIHDAIWGTHFFEPYELSIISLPIFQRLRQVSQMGFVNYIYPSARHTRFEHSLGVTIVANKLFQYAKKEHGSSLLDDNDLRHIRIAGLLHDIGHGLFSHTSEEAYGYMLDEIIEQEFENVNVDPKPHEFLSYLLIKTDSFRKFFRWLKRKYNLDIDSQKIADMIIGLPQSEESRYKVSFINGSFDADKLDYFYRDSRFSGIPVQLDLDRLFNVMSISDLSKVCDPSDVLIRDLTIGLSGVTCLEQIIFNKMILFSTIYHHQKVKACDCMFKGALEYIKEKGLEIRFKEKSCKFDNPIDFITLTDIDFFAEGSRTKDKLLHDLIHNILYRRILKRALVISKRTIEGDLNQLLSTKVNRHQKEQELREVARQITELAGNPCTPYEVWIDIPTVPSFGDAATTYVRTNKNNPDEGLQPLEKFFPLKEWKENYEFHKLKGHIFCPEHCMDNITQAAIEVFREKYNIRFKGDAMVYN